ncbi:MAG: TRAP transporter substrate-binding protein DctP, partial [Rectinema sp.]|nr:TRAP transporter substrate-binding protein DctP [Rectinema sp.]
MKKTGIAALIMLLVLVPAMLFAQAKPIVLRLAETHPKGYHTELGDEEFARLVKERSNGRIIIEVYPGSQLGQEKAVIEQVQFGAIDLTRVSISPVAS